MASTYVNDLRLEEIGSGEQSGSWGDTTNTNLELIAEAFSFGTEAITTNADTHTTTIADGATDPGRSLFLKYTGTLDSACTITIAPNTVSKLWFIENGTSGSQNILISQGSGANVTIPAGQTKAIYSNGGGSGAAMVDAFATLNVVDLLVDDDLTVTDDVAIGGLATVGGTLGVTGIATFTDDIIIGDGKTIGSASTVGAITIASDGDTTFSADLNVGANFDVTGNAVIDGTALVTGVLTTTAATVFNGGFASNADSTMGTDKKLIFRDSAIHISSTADGDMSIAADDEIDLTSTLIDINGAVDMSSTLAVTGVVTVSNGSVSAPAIAFASDTDTGIIRGGTNNIAFVAAGATRTYIDANTHLATSTAGTSNLALGVNAGNSIASGGNYNTVVGDEAGTAISTGDQITAVGYQAGAAMSTNSQSSFFGYQAGLVSDAPGNNFFGFAAGGNTTSGFNNVAMGNLALFTNVDGDNNTAIGSNALRYLEPADGSSYNTAVGSQAGINLSTGTINTFVGGLSAGDGVVTGTHNVGVGAETLYALTSGISNVIMGFQAGSKITTGADNVAVGREALETEDTGSASTAVGHLALRVQNNDALNHNTAVGYQSGVAVSSGTGNTLLGSFAGHNVQTGTNNTIIGFNNGMAATGNTGSILIGSNGTGAGDNTARFQVSAGSCTINLDGSDTSWAASSDSRLKKDVADCAVGLDFIKDLRPITYKWDAKDAIANTLPQYDADSSDPVYGSGKTQHGFLAQEVKTAIDAHSGLKNGFSMWSEDPNGTQQIAPAALIPMLVNAIQELEARIAILEG
jgi:trimeric autotransporter adhesin